MCGIICAIKKVGKHKGPPLRQVVKEQFLAQKSRGVNGFGIIEIMPGGRTRVLRTTDEIDFLMQLRFDVNKDAMAVIAHHRIPTSSANRLDQTHPLLVSAPKVLTKEWLTVHNGIITNDDELKEKHEKMGIPYRTTYLSKYNTYDITKFNDSEALAVELALMLEGLQDDVETRGAAAFFTVGMDPRTKVVDKVFFGRNYNPLSFKETDDLILIASEVDGGEAIKTDTLFSIDLKDFTLVKKPCKFPEVTSYGNSWTPSTASSAPKSETKPVVGFEPKKEPVMAGKEVGTGEKVTAANEEENISWEFNNPELEDVRASVVEALDELLLELDDDEDVTTMDWGADSTKFIDTMCDLLNTAYANRHKDALADALKSSTTEEGHEIDDTKKEIEDLAATLKGDTKKAKEVLAKDEPKTDLDRTMKEINDAYDKRTKPLLEGPKKKFATPLTGKRWGEMNAEERKEYIRHNNEVILSTMGSKHPKHKGLIDRLEDDLYDAKNAARHD